MTLPSGMTLNFRGLEMRWKTPVPPASPELLDTRVTTRFAFFPTALSDGYTVWLERYVQNWVYDEYTYWDVDFGDCNRVGWLKTTNGVKPAFKHRIPPLGVSRGRH